MPDFVSLMTSEFTSEVLVLLRVAISLGIIAGLIRCS